MPREIKWLSFSEFRWVIRVITKYTLCLDISEYTRQQWSHNSRYKRWIKPDQASCPSIERKSHKPAKYRSFPGSSHTLYRQQLPCIKWRTWANFLPSKDLKYAPVRKTGEFQCAESKWRDRSWRWLVSNFQMAPVMTRTNYFSLQDISNAKISATSSASTYQVTSMPFIVRCLSLMLSTNFWRKPFAFPNESHNPSLLQSGLPRTSSLPPNHSTRKLLGTNTERTGSQPQLQFSRNFGRLVSIVRLDTLEKTHDCGKSYGRNKMSHTDARRYGRKHRDARLQVSSLNRFSQGISVFFWSVKVNCRRKRAALESDSNQRTSQHFSTRLSVLSLIPALSRSGKIVRPYIWVLYSFRRRRIWHYKIFLSTLEPSDHPEAHSTYSNSQG